MLWVLRVVVLFFGLMKQISWGLTGIRLIIDGHSLLSLVTDYISEVQENYETNSYSPVVTENEILGL